MVKVMVSVVLCTALLCAGYSAYADTAADLTEVYTDSGVPGLERTAPSGFQGILGVGLFNGERIIGDTRRRTVPLPIFLMTYQDWAYWSIGGGGVWLLQSGDHALKLGVGVKLHPGYQPDDAPGLIGMEKRKTSLDGCVNILWKTHAVNVGVRYYHDVFDVSDGDSLTLRFSRNFLIDPSFRLTPSIGIEWLNAKYVDYYYGVRPAEALPDRPSYAGRDTVNIGAGVAGSFHISRSWSLLGGFYGTRLGSGITDSPIVARSFSTLIYFGAGWIF